MLSFSRAPGLVALLFLVLTFIVVPMPALASSVRSWQTAPTAGSCCSPSQLARVEARLPVHPVNPAIVVRTVTHLNMVSVQILPNNAIASIHRSNGVNTIQYDFGYVAPTTGNLFVRRHPRYVRVIETVEQRRASGISITKVLRGVQTTPIPAGYYSPLMLVVAQPQRHLTVFIESNIPRARLHLLGELLVREARAGGTAAGKTVDH